MRLVPPVPRALVDAVTEVADMAPGVLVEEKGAAVAVHYRNVLDARLLLEQRLAEVVARHPAFTLRTGRRVIEIVPEQYSKGTALAWLMTIEPFQGRRPVMIRAPWRTRNRQTARADGVDGRQFRSWSAELDGRHARAVQAFARL